MKVVLLILAGWVALAALVAVCWSLAVYAFSRPRRSPRDRSR